MRDAITPVEDRIVVIKEHGLLIIPMIDISFVARISEDGKSLSTFAHTCAESAEEQLNLLRKNAIDRMRDHEGRLYDLERARKIVKFMEEMGDSRPNSRVSLMAGGMPTLEELDEQEAYTRSALAISTDLISVFTEVMVEYNIAIQAEEESDQPTQDSVNDAFNQAMKRLGGPN